MLQKYFRKFIQQRPGTRSEAASVDSRLSGLVVGRAQPSIAQPRAAQHSPAQQRSPGWEGSRPAAEPYCRPLPTPGDPLPAVPASTWGANTLSAHLSALFLCLCFFSSLPSVLDQRERKVLRNADCTVAGAMEEDRGGAPGNRDHRGGS